MTKTKFYKGRNKKFTNAVKNQGGDPSMSHRGSNPSKLPPLQSRRYELLCQLFRDHLISLEDFVRFVRAPDIDK